MNQKLNVELLKKVIGCIQANPHNFMMNDWINECGTAGCIAGWTCLIEQGEAKPENFISVKRTCYVGQHAATLLGLEENCAAKLFYVGRWPAQFHAQWYSARTAEQRVEAAVARIEHFIEKGE